MGMQNAGWMCEATASCPPALSISPLSSLISIHLYPLYPCGSAKQVRRRTAPMPPGSRGIPGTSCWKWGRSGT